MPSNFLTNSTSTPTPDPSDSASSSSDAQSAAASPKTTPAEMWSYLWIPFLISLSKELSLAKAQSTIVLPSQLGTSDSSSTRCAAPDPKLNYRPVIGILSHPGDGASGRLSNASTASYIAASYVKFVESAGARVIPLIYNEPRDILFQKLDLVNGVLFTGGWAKRGLYYDVVERIFQKIIEKNDAGDHFPLYAICLGFELLTMIISKNKKILESFSAVDVASTLQFTENTIIEGTVFQRFPPDLLRKLSTDCLVMQNHKYGISPERLMENENLSSFFKILTTCTDEDDKVYVSTAHAYNYPVTAFQWHPEKNAFEWGLPMIPHSEDAIQVTQHVANFLVSEARKSLNRPPVGQVLDNLIYNYSPTFCGKAGKGYDEVYIFTQPSLTHLFPPDLFRKLGADCLVMQNHKYGISPERLMENENLSSFFKILTTCTDADDKVYVSTAHAYNYPVTAFQWHPEKNAFEWGLPMIPHSEDAIQVTQHVANFLVREARKSLNRPPVGQVLDNLIYNYSPTFCGKAGKGYNEVYIFTQPSPAHL